MNVSFLNNKLGSQFAYIVARGTSRFKFSDTSRHDTSPMACRYERSHALKGCEMKMLIMSLLCVVVSSCRNNPSPVKDLYVRASKDFFDTLEFRGDGYFRRSMFGVVKEGTFKKYGDTLIIYKNDVATTAFLKFTIAQNVVLCNLYELDRVSSTYNKSGLCGIELFLFTMPGVDLCDFKDSLPSLKACMPNYVTCDTTLYDQDCELKGRID